MQEVQVRSIRYRSCQPQAHWRTVPTYHYSVGWIAQEAHSDGHRMPITREPDRLTIFIAPDISVSPKNKKIRQIILHLKLAARCTTHFILPDSNAPSTTRCRLLPFHVHAQHELALIDNNASYKTFAPHSAACHES